MMSITRRVVLWSASAVVVADRVAAQSEPRPPRLGLKGHDPVAYFTEGKPLRGSAAYATVWDGVRWQFASQRHLELFRADPDRYAPQFNGSCAMRMSVGEKVEGDPNNWLITGGRLFVFATPAGPARFAADAGRREQAGENWAQLRDAPTRR